MSIYLLPFTFVRFIILLSCFILFRTLVVWFKTILFGMFLLWILGTLGLLSN